MCLHSPDFGLDGQAIGVQFPEVNISFLEITNTCSESRPGPCQFNTEVCN